MRDPKRIDVILDRIREQWIKYPDQRLGQILVNYFGYGDRMLFHEEDDKFGVNIWDASTDLQLHLEMKSLDGLPRATFDDPFPDEYFDDFMNED